MMHNGGADERGAMRLAAICKDLLKMPELVAFSNTQPETFKRGKWITDCLAVLFISQFCLFMSLSLYSC